MPESQTEAGRDYSGLLPSLMYATMVRLMVCNLQPRLSSGVLKANSSPALIPLYLGIFVKKSSARLLGSNSRKLIPRYRPYKNLKQTVRKFNLIN